MYEKMWNKNKKKRRLPIPGAHKYPKSKLETNVDLSNGYLRIDKYFFYALTRFKLSGLQRAAFDVIIQQYWGSPDNKKDSEGYATIPLSKFVAETGRDKGNLSKAIAQIKASNMIKTKKNLEVGRKHEKLYKINKRYWEWLTDDPEFYYWCRDSKLWKVDDSISKQYGSWENFREHRKRERESQPEDSGRANDLAGDMYQGVGEEPCREQSDEQLLQELDGV
jgi:hypothetical protein